MSARPYKITTGLRPLSAPARDPATGEASSLQAKIQKMQCVGPETFPSPFLKEVAKGSPVAEEFAKMFTQAEDEIASLTVREVDELRAVIAAQARRIESLQAQLQSQHQQLHQQGTELHQQKANAVQATSVIAEQQKQLQELRAEASAAADTNDKQKMLLIQREARAEQLKEQLKESLARSKEVVALRQKDIEELQQLRRQQNSLARHIRAEKTMENEKKEAVMIARHAAELRKVTAQRDALAAAIKKQFKLIEVLKQQKAHLEAARWLQFTEEEFLKVVDTEGTFVQAKAEQHQQQQQQQQEVQ